jgi:hypothetical protein
MLLGHKQFDDLMDETARTFFLERSLIVDFEKYCVAPLELRDREMRECFFGPYRRLVYVRQPLDEDLSIEADKLAKFLELPLEIRDSNYMHLEEELTDLIEKVIESLPEPIRK